MNLNANAEAVSSEYGAEDARPPVVASFRFYAELNGFVAPNLRGCRFDAVCARAATVKHMIEALGPPHTEVGLVLVNDEPGTLDRIMRHGDRISAYPWFHTLDVSTVTGVPPRAPAAHCFIADSHLGGLAHLLRLAGFDTLYHNNYADKDIEHIAASEARIVLTRDVELLKRSQIAYGCFVHAIKPEAQFTEVARRYSLADHAKPFHLCLSCNTPLQPLSAADARPHVPPSVQERHTRFSTCDTCRRIFWEGSHWRRMRSLLDDVLLPAQSGKKAERRDAVNDVAAATK